MAWLWWLLAPVLSTVAGACVFWWLGRRELDSVRPRDAMGEHRALLAALAPAVPAGPAPVTMLVCAETETETQTELEPGQHQVAGARTGVGIAPGAPTTAPAGSDAITASSRVA